jgi:NADH-quinone oxidoreductase subunit H
MGSSAIEILINATKIILIFLIMVKIVPLLVWVERRGSAFIQHRFGPNRVGPLGLFQLLADAVKFLNKEEFVPKEANKKLFYAAPVLALIPAALAFLAIPLGTPINWSFNDSMLGDISIPMQGAVIPMGIIYILGVSSLAAYSLLIAGWSSSNKYSIMGALRASAQMISYELALGVAIIGVILVYGTFDLTEIIIAQEGPLRFSFRGTEYALSFLPNWGIFYQPVGFLLFLVAAFAESNRTPFDLPEAEAELVAGYHTEYSGFKMNLFYIGEYGHMMVASALLSIFYFGGFNIPGITATELAGFLEGVLENSNQVSLAMSLIYFAVSFIKILFFLWVFIWVRWTLPRFRYDQLMDLGWKTLLPWTLANVIVTSLVIFISAG